MNDASSRLSSARRSCGSGGGAGQHPSRRWYRRCWGRRLGRATLVHFAEMADVRSSRWCRRCRFRRAALIDDAEADRPAWSSSRGEMSSGLNSRASHDDGRVIEQLLLNLRRRGSDEDEGGCSAPEGGATDAAEDVSCNKKSIETHQMGWRLTEDVTYL